MVIKNTRNMFEAALMSTHNLCLEKKIIELIYTPLHPTLQEKLGCDGGLIVRAC